MSNQSTEIIIFFLGTTMLILFLAVCVATLLYLYQKKHLAFLRNLEELKTNHENNILKTQIEIQEQTLEQVSQEIHDNIGLSLTLAKLQLNVLDNEVIRKVQPTIHLLSRAIDDLSNLSKILNREFIGNNGFIRALEIEVDQIRTTLGTRISLEVTGYEDTLEKPKEVILFRIIQEALNNIFKHSNCTCVSIAVYKQKSALIVSIADNGRGIAEGDIRGCGIMNMEKRAQLINGRFILKTVPSFGTEININIPLE